jgi:hypothetical protein
MVHVLLRKFSDDITADFVTARTDRWTDRRCEISGAHAERACECRNGCPRRATRKSAPARVHGRHNTGTAIGHQQGHAVRGLDGERSRMIGTNECVGFRARWATLVRGCDANSVNLPEP